MSQNNNKSDLKKFFIKLLAITFSIIIIINITYNLIFAEKFENINILLSLKNKESREVVKNKIRSEIKKGLEKDKILNDEDKVLIYKFYSKIRKELQDIEK